MFRSHRAAVACIAFLVGITASAQGVAAGDAKSDPQAVRVWGSWQAGAISIENRDGNRVTGIHYAIGVDLSRGRYWGGLGLRNLIIPNGANISGEGAKVQVLYVGLTSTAPTRVTTRAALGVANVTTHYKIGTSKSMTSESSSGVMGTGMASYRVSPHFAMALAADVVAAKQVIGGLVLRFELGQVSH